MQAFRETLLRDSFSTRGMKVKVISRSENEFTRERRQDLQVLLDFKEAGVVFHILATKVYGVSSASFVSLFFCNSDNAFDNEIL